MSYIKKIPHPDYSATHKNCNRTVVVKVVYTNLNVMQIKKFRTKKTHGTTFSAGKQNKFSKISSATVVW